MAKTGKHCRSGNQSTSRWWTRAKTPFSSCLGTESAGIMRRVIPSSVAEAFMKCWRITSRIRFAAGALLALLWLSLAPISADASCGDYVSIVSDSPGESSSQPVKPSKPSPCARSESQNPLRAPCEGPRCSGNPPPAAPPMTVAPTTAERDPVGLTFAPYELEPRNLIAFISTRESAPPVQLASSIFHPPRPR
jgi:hypothetical protein